MAEETAAATRAPRPGKPFNFNLVGDDFLLYEETKTAYEDEAERDDERVSDALADLPFEVRALIAARLTPSAATRTLSQREVFVRAMSEARAYRDMLAEQDEVCDALPPVEDESGYEDSEEAAA